MNYNVKHLFAILLLLIICIAIVVGLFWKANNPSDYRHPRDREIRLY